MKLYYTVASQENIAQKKIDYSLGGFKSSSQVPNGMIGNLFSELSLLALDRKLNEYIALVLYNDTGDEVSDITVYFDYPVDGNAAQTNLCKFEIAAVALNETDNSMEIVENIYAQPYNAEFHEADGVANAVNLGSLVNNKGIGIWIKRSIIDSRVTDLFDPDTLNDNYVNSVTPLKVEEITIKINWQVSN